MAIRRFAFVSVFLAALFAGGFASAESILNTPAASGRGSEPGGVSDHDLVVRDIGLRVVHWGKVEAGVGQLLGGGLAGAGAAAAVNPNQTANLNLTTIGLRYWLSKRIGIDAGVALFLHKPKMGDTQFGFGIAGGIPIALGVFKHITVFAEPRLDLSWLRLAKDTNAVMFGMGADLGAELSFGFIGIPRLTTQLAFGLDLRLQYDSVSKKTDVVLATRDFLDSLAFNLGVTYYF